MWISLALKNNHDIKMFIVQLLDTLGVIFLTSVGIQPKLD